MPIRIERGVDKAAYTAIYLLWLGCGYQAVVTDSDPQRYLYLGAAASATAILTWFLLDVFKRVQTSGDSKRVHGEPSRLLESVHILCLDPTHCSRCSGFAWTFYPTAIFSVTLGTQIHAAIEGLPLSFAGSLGVSSLLFVTSGSLHGLLNALNEADRIDLPDWWFQNAVKALMGAIAGVSISWIAVSLLGLLSYTTPP